MLFIDKLVKAEQEALAQPGDPRRGVVAVLRAFEGTEFRTLMDQAADVRDVSFSRMESALSLMLRLTVAEAGR